MGARATSRVFLAVVVPLSAVLVVAAAPAPATEQAPPPTGRAATDSLTGVGLKLLLGSLLLALLLYGAARVVRRLPVARLLPTAEGLIKVIGRTHLGPKGSLCLVEVAGTRVLLAVTATAIETLHVWAANDEASAAPPAAGGRPAPVPGQLRGLENRLAGRRG